MKDGAASGRRKPAESFGNIANCKLQIAEGSGRGTMGGGR